MKRNSIIVFTLALSLVMLVACGGGTDVVPSGTYNGTVDKVEAGKSEIYVKTDDGKTLELYFTDSTKLLQNGAEVGFDKLAKGQTVEVKVEKVGKRLDPITVKIKD